MSAIPTIVPVSDLRRDASGILAKVAQTREPVVITQRGYPRAVIQDIDEYQFLQKKLEIAELLAAGEKDIQEGNTVPVDEAIKHMYDHVTQLETAR